MSDLFLDNRFWVQNNACGTDPAAFRALKYAPTRQKSSQYWNWPVTTWCACGGGGDRLLIVAVTAFRSLRSYRGSSPLLLLIIKTLLRRQNRVRMLMNRIPLPFTSLPPMSPLPRPLPSLLHPPLLKRNRSLASACLPRPPQCQPE